MTLSPSPVTDERKANLRARERRKGKRERARPLIQEQLCSVSQDPPDNSVSEQGAQRAGLETKLNSNFKARHKASHTTAAAGDNDMAGQEAVAGANQSKPTPAHQGRYICSRADQRLQNVLSWWHRRLLCATGTEYEERGSTLGALTCYFHNLVPGNVVVRVIPLQVCDRFWRAAFGVI